MENNNYTEDELNQVCEDAFVNVKEACKRLQEKTKCSNEVVVSMLGNVAEFYISQDDPDYQHDEESITSENTQGYQKTYPEVSRKIERFKYKRSVKKTNSNQSGPGANDIKGSSLGTIILPMPKVSDSTGAQWGKSELNVFGAALLGAGSNIFNLDRESSPDSNAVGNLDEQLRKLNKINKKTAGKGLEMGEFKGGLIAGGAMVAEKTMNFLGQNVTADQILARSRGQILNPNAELLFSGPVLRQFSFTFLLLARSKREGSEIRKIIRTFKEGAVPKHVNDALLTNPDIWQLTYKRNDRELKTVNKFGAMGLTTITVDYAPEGFWTAYEDSQPVACRLNLEFGEVRPLYQQDYEGSSDSVGY